MPSVARTFFGGGFWSPFAHRQLNSLCRKGLLKSRLHVAAQEFVRLGNAARADHKDTVDRLQVELGFNHRGTNAPFDKISARLAPDFPGGSDTDKTGAGQKNDRADLSSDSLPLRKDLLEPCFGWTLGYHASMDRSAQKFD